MYLLFCFCVKIIMEVIKLKKGQTKRIWTKEQKLAIIKRYYEEHISAGSLAKEWTIVKKVDRGMRKISKVQPRHARRTKVQSD